MQGCSSGLHTHFLSSECSQDTGWRRRYRKARGGLLSLHPSPLAVQHCSASLHMPRPTARETQQSWSTLEIWTDTHSCTRTSRFLRVNNKSHLTQMEMSPWTFWKGHGVRCVRNQTGDLFISSSDLFCLKVTVPRTSLLCKQRIQSHADSLLCLFH